MVRRVALNTANIFPVKNATVPYWRSQLHPIDEHRSTEDLPSECDIAIIGVEMSDVATAYHLANIKGSNPAPSIVLLEARQVCSGATGRNGGHIKTQTQTIHRMIKTHGFEAAMEIANLVQEQHFAVKEAVETEGLGCEFELRRSYDVFIDESQAEQVRLDFKASLKAGESWTRQCDFMGPEFVQQVR